MGQYHLGKQPEIMDLIHIMNIFPLSPSKIHIKSSEENKQNLPESARMINKISELTYLKYDSPNSIHVAGKWFSDGIFI